MNSSLHSMFTPRRKRARTWDAESHSGFLWIWTGKFKRWRRREFSAAQPGLLTYTSRQKRGKAKGLPKKGSINLHGVSLEAGSDSRMIVIKTPGGTLVYLRTTDPDDREACLNSLQNSIAAYGTLLRRASSLLGVPPREGELLGNFKPSKAEKAAELSGEIHIIRQYQQRANARLEGLKPFQDAFRRNLASVQSKLSAAAAALSLDGGYYSPGDPGGVPFGQQSADQRAGERASAGEEADSDAHSCRSEAPLYHADSFQSATSELLGSPVWREENHHNTTGQNGPSPAETPLSSSWRQYTDAVQEAVRSEAVRVVELQAENEALKAALRNFKSMAQANARKLKVLSLRSDNSGRLDCERTGSSGSDDLEAPTPNRQPSDDWAQRTYSKDVSEDVSGMSTAMTNEYKDALEALEAVRRHAFAVNSQYAQVLPAADEPPPEPEPEDAEFDDAASEDEGERGGSRRTLSLQMENPWEVAARRDRLPAPAPLQRGFSIWSVLKNALGKDLTRITLPATINEPLSALQRIVEDLEYRHLLDEAAASRQPWEKMLLIAAFIASGYSSSLDRGSKPFNPLLGETFEWQAADSSCRFVCEQVSHHPPISCWWSESATAGWQYWGEIELRSKFWGKSVEMMPTGTCWLQLGGELWSWNKANMSINNIILGTISLEWHGKITISNHTTGATATLQFPKCNGNLSNRGVVQCTIQDERGAPIYHLGGKYTDRLVAVPDRKNASTLAEREVYRINPPAEQGALQYNLTKMAMTLNSADPELLRQLPPTDSRLRPDQRALEDGDLERATPEKMRLEDKQREARGRRKERGEPFFPVWFKLRSMKEKQREGADHWLGSRLVLLPGEAPPCLWEFTGEYWDAKQKLDWGRCPDIYSLPAESSAGSKRSSS